MKLSFSVFNFLFVITLFCFTNSASGQQNFINVPSSEVTKSKGLFFQQQLNFNQLIQSNTTLDYGLGKGFEIGVNLLGLNFSENSRAFIKNDTGNVDPYNPLLMLNGLREFQLNERYSISTGAQFGINFTNGNSEKPAHLVYTNFLIKDLFMEKCNLVFGSYYNSIHYGGKAGNRLGLWLGSEIPLSPRLHIVGESVIGDNALAFTSLGMIYFLTKKFPVTLGMQIPNVKANGYAFVLELTYVP